MSKKRNCNLTRFGNYLRMVRSLKNIGTQVQVAKMLQKKGLNSSQSLLAQYETGRIADPDPDLLRALAEIYGIDWVEMVLQLVEEKYALSGNKWETVRKAFPQDECTFCKLVHDSIGELISSHKH